MITTHKVKELIRQRFAWPGGYEIILVTGDGGIICVPCARRNWEQIVHAIRFHHANGWLVIGHALDCDTDEEIECSNCNRIIKEAYQECEVATISKKLAEKCFGKESKITRRIEKSEKLQPRSIHWPFGALSTVDFLMSPVL